MNMRAYRAQLKQPTFGTWCFIGLAVFVLFTLARLPKDVPLFPPDVPAEPPADYIAIKACETFNRVAVDARDGVITDVAAAIGLQHTFDIGRDATNPVARDAFYEFQRTRLNGSRDQRDRATAKLIALCQTWGHR